LEKKNSDVVIFNVKGQILFNCLIYSPQCYGISPDDKYAVFVTKKNTLKLLKINFPKQKEPDKIVTEKFEVELPFNRNTILLTAVSDSAKLILLYRTSTEVNEIPETSPSDDASDSKSIGSASDIVQVEVEEEEDDDIKEIKPQIQIEQTASPLQVYSNPESLMPLNAKPASPMQSYAKSVSPMHSYGESLLPMHTLDLVEQIGERLESLDSGYTQKSVSPMHTYDAQLRNGGETLNVMDAIDATRPFKMKKKKLSTRILEKLTPSCAKKMSTKTSEPQLSVDDATPAPPAPPVPNKYKEKSKSPMRSYEKSASPMQSYAKSESPMQSYAKSRSPMQSYAKSSSPMQSYAKSESPMHSYEKEEKEVKKEMEEKKVKKEMEEKEVKEVKEKKDIELEIPKNITTATAPATITHNIVVYPIVKKSNIFKNNGLILTGHTDYINSIIFVHSALHGEQNLFTIVSAGNDRTVRVWNVHLRDTTVTGSCASVFDLLAGAASLNLNVIPVRDSENKNNGSYGQLVVGDLYGRVYWLHLMKKDL